MGAAIEYGTFGKYFGVSLVGLAYLTNVDPWGMTVGYSEAPGSTYELVDSTNGITGKSLLPEVRVNLGVLRLFQPQVRVAVWRFMFSLQLGLEFRSGQILEVGVAGDSPDRYPDGFVILDLLAAARLNIRFFIYEGFYAMASGNFALYLIGNTNNFGSRDGNSWGLNGGLGYAF
jgi:hypothetical protein